MKQSTFKIFAGAVLVTISVMLAMCVPGFEEDNLTGMVLTSIISIAFMAAAVYVSGDECITDKNEDNE